MSNSVSFSPKVGFTGLHKSQVGDFMERLVRVTSYAVRNKDDHSAKIVFKIASQLDEFEKQNPGQVVRKPCAFFVNNMILDHESVGIPALSRHCKTRALYVLDNLGKLGDFGKTLDEACKNMGLTR
ncbi:MAG TPA: hypothetical protein DDW90_04540 [Cyanobacteria bacterium UBA9971]|nr:hypothetical protein [Cyanobacteria bacterium UBA9971]